MCNPAASGRHRQSIVEDSGKHADYRRCMHHQKSQLKCSATPAVGGFDAAMMVNSPFVAIFRADGEVGAGCTQQVMTNTDQCK